MFAYETLCSTCFYSLRINRETENDSGAPATRPSKETKRKASDSATNERMNGSVSDFTSDRNKRAKERVRVSKLEEEGRKRASK